MRRNSPLLDRPCAGWQADLPGPTSEIAKGAIFTAPVNEQNHSFLEISRPISPHRGAALLLAVFQTIASVIYLIWSFGILIPASFFGFDPLMIVVQILAVGFCAILPIFLICSAVLPPRDCPIRFNRALRKVYTYGFNVSWFSFPTRWHVTTNTYQWEDLRAELWRQRGFTPHGGLIISWGISIAVVKPGTNLVIDRFPLSVGEDEGSLWDYVRTYMQLGPDALPQVKTSRDPNAVSGYNLALRLAPKVQWPAEMDAESRSGVLQGDCQYAKSEFRG